MSSLYEINEQLLECIDQETGEILDISKFDGLQMERDTKLENIALWYKNLLSEAEQYKNEKNLFADREKRARTKAESLKSYLDTALKGSKFSTVKVDISYRKSSSVNVLDMDKLPEEYKKSVTTVSADKLELAKILKSGTAIDGAEIVESNNIQIK
jgi:hypothetical protein